MCRNKWGQYPEGINEVSTILLTNGFEASADDVVVLIESPSVGPDKCHAVDADFVCE